MNPEPLIFGSVIVGVVVGLVGLLAGEATGGDPAMVAIGGAVVLLSVGVLTLKIARLAPEGG